MPPASRSTSASCTTCTAAGWSTSVTRARRSERESLPEMLPAGQRVRGAVEEQHDTFACLDAADDGEAHRRLRRRRAARSPRRSRGRRSVAPAASGTRSSSTTHRTPERRAMCPASTGRPSEMSTSACAAAPSRRPSSIRSGGRTYAWRRNAAPAAPSGPVTTSTSPGCAPARPGTRGLRPNAVTETTTVSDDVVSPPTTGTPVSAIPS